MGTITMIESKQSEDTRVVANVYHLRPRMVCNRMYALSYNMYALSLGCLYIILLSLLVISIIHNNI